MIPQNLVGHSCLFGKTQRSDRKDRRHYEARQEYERANSFEEPRHQLH